MNRTIILLSVLLIAGCEDGRNGPEGNRGKRGYAGSDGLSCSVAPTTNGSVITCGDGSTTVILNGVDGTSAPTAYTVVEVIKPCPGTDAKEVLLKLYNGDILAHYSHGSKQYLALLTPGTYQLTDGSHCVFTVHSDMTVTW